MVDEEVYVIVDHNDKIIWIKPCDSKTKDCYMQEAVREQNEKCPEDLWSLKKCRVVER